MKGGEEVEHSGSEFTYESGEVWFFQPEYTMAKETPHIGIQKRVYTSDSAESFSASNILFQVEPVAGVPQELCVSWFVPGGDDIVTELQCHGKAKHQVLAHGFHVMHFDEVGLKTFSIYVSRGRQKLFHKTVTAHAECPPYLVEDGTCKLFSGDFSVQSRGDIQISLAWDMAFGSDVTADIHIGNEEKIGGISESGELELLVAKPGDVDITLRVFAGEAGEMVHESTRSVRVSCLEETENFMGKACVPKCKAVTGGKEPSRGPHGECIQHCDEGHVPVMDSVGSGICVQ